MSSAHTGASWPGGVLVRCRGPARRRAARPRAPGRRPARRSSSSRPVGSIIGWGTPRVYSSAPRSSSTCAPSGAGRPVLLAQRLVGVHRPEQLARASAAPRSRACHRRTARAPGSARGSSRRGRRRATGVPQPARAGAAAPTSRAPAAAPRSSVRPPRWRARQPPRAAPSSPRNTATAGVSAALGRAPACADVGAGGLETSEHRAGVPGRRRRGRGRRAAPSRPPTSLGQVPAAARRSPARRRTPQRSSSAETSCAPVPAAATTPTAPALAARRAQHVGEAEPGAAEHRRPRAGAHHQQAELARPAVLSSTSSSQRARRR